MAGRQSRISCKPALCTRLCAVRACLRSTKSPVHVVAVLTRFSKKSSHKFLKRPPYKDDTEAPAEESNRPVAAELSENSVATPNTSLHKIVIGVDFGTTYTGACTANSRGIRSSLMAQQE